MTKRMTATVGGVVGMVAGALVAPGTVWASPGQGGLVGLLLRPGRAGIQGRH